LGGEAGADADFEFHYGLGVRGLLTDWLALRVEARHYLTDAVAGGLATNLAVTVGADFFAWTASAAPPLDTDLDGIPDSDDKCPLVKGLEATAGCPDRDGDGVADGDDKCPDVKGSPALKGCPDRDGDGVADDDDRCPDTKGLATNKGCPPAPTDRDKDGIPDAKDRCPDDAGVAEHQGCADRDGDHIADPDDKCPDQAGTKEEKGCLPAAVAKFSGTIEGIYFGSGSAKIKKKSFVILNEAAEALKQFPTLRLAIEGHTDNKGKAKKNLKLSQKRADAVKKHLIKKGITADRLDARGFGPERPIADNKTNDGRAKNRRIEFKLLSK
jgi:outer membrane protein OmpA-like peptidoglycan-associated protein